MSLFAVFGIGQTELIIIVVILGIMAIPVIAVGLVFLMMAMSRGRNDRQP